MKFAEIASYRLKSQQLCNPDIASADALVGYFGAMQAQDPAMCKWALGVRIPGLSDAAVEKLMDSGKILRTHVLRPTWHLVHPDDVSWMIDLTAPNIRRLMKTNDRHLGLDEKTYAKALDVIGVAVNDHGPQTRKELMEILEFSGIDTSEYRSGHFLIAAELEKIIISGSRKGKEATYAAFKDRVKKEKNLDREEALAELARRYFQSHGPSILEDFCWWSGLNKTDSRKGIGAIEKELESVEIEGRKYLFSEGLSAINTKSAHLLPAFDEFFIGYKDRTAALEQMHHKKAMSVNGIFRPVMLLDGQGVGLWKRTLSGNRMDVFFEYLSNVPKNREKDFEKQQESFEKFLDFG